jgi:hypothetical protein
MNYLRIWELLVPYFVSYGFWYFVGSFISASWYPDAWTWELKVVMTIWAFFFGLAILWKLEAENGHR